MNESNSGSPPQRGFLHSSPKKKLSFRSQDKIEDVRRGLKDARDISARNLMAKLDCDDNNSDSTLEEVVVIEEVTEELEDDESYIEEIIDESDDEDSYLEPLPPPIEIPDALQVKEDDDDAAVDRSSSDDDSDDDDSEDERKATPPSVKEGPVVTEQTIAKEPVADVAEPVAQEEEPDPVFTVAEETQPVEAVDESTNGEETDDDDVHEMNHTLPSQVKSVRPSAVRGMSYAVEEKSASSVAAVMQASEVKPETTAPVDGDSSIAWTKPDWTKNTKLRPTGKSATENLAKPITTLPHLKRDVGDSSAATPRTPAAASKPKVKQTPKTPTPSSGQFEPQTEETACPKSAPSRPNAALSSNEDMPKIEWTKPEWTRKKVLRDTSKGAKLLSGQEISRPIGGIRPVQD